MRDFLHVFLKDKVDCIVCGKSYIPNEKKNHDKGVVPYYANNFCSKDCVETMDEVSEVVNDV